MWYRIDLLIDGHFMDIISITGTQKLILTTVRTSVK